MDILEFYRRAFVIEAAIQEVERAFTFYGVSDNGALLELAALRLNRKPVTPGILTWGVGLNDGNRSGVRSWRLGAREIYFNSETERVGGKYDLAFMRQLREILVSAHNNINRHLKQDPRWGVFLLNRVGHHEWVPEGMASDTGNLRPEWLGQWELKKVFLDWIPLRIQPEVTRASIYKNGKATRITFQTAKSPTAPLQDASACNLRYSGGLTFWPSENTNTATGWQLGGLVSEPIPTIDEVFKPLLRINRYKQVLVQCPEGEWFDNIRIRFLLLAGDSIIEVARESSGMYVRHFRRVSTSASGLIGDRRSSGPSGESLSYPQ